GIARGSWRCSACPTRPRCSRPGSRYRRATRRPKARARRRPRFLLSFGSPSREIREGRIYARRGLRRSDGFGIMRWVRRAFWLALSLGALLASAYGCSDESDDAGAAAGRGGSGATRGRGGASRGGSSGGDASTAGGTGASTAGGTGGAAGGGGG